jgi:hypothetical protein
VAPTLTAFGAHLGVAEVLVGLSGIAAPWLAVLPAPLGFAPRRRARTSVMGWSAPLLQQAQSGDNER